MFAKDGKFLGNYYVGLDIGTESVGWAVVDDDMNLVKRHGRHLWGSRLFDKAVSAADRRGKRSMRRRLLRRRVRLAELRKLLADFVGDNEFFERLDESFLHKGDRSQHNHDILFYNSEATIFDTLNKKIERIDSDQKYYKNFPTIFHLRKDIIDNAEVQYDPKLIFLAIHNILKYRGNFLYEGLNLSSDDTEGELTHEFFLALDVVEEEYSYLVGDEDAENFLHEINSQELKAKLFEILMDSKKGAKEKKNAVSALCPKYKKQLEQFTLMLLGNKFKYKDFFATDEENEEKSESFSFADDVEQKIADSGEYVEFLSACQRLYSIFTFQRIMGDKKYISEIMVERYKTYNQQLHMLKEVFRNVYSREEYRAFFRDLNISSKVNYARFTEGDSKANCSLEDLQKDIKKRLKNIDKSNLTTDLAEKVEKLLKWCEDDSIFIKPRNRTNGVFPMQANRLELEKILKNQSKFYPELSEGGELYEKILALFNFRIDYFVGPLGKRAEHGERDFGWLVKNAGYENIPVTPFNYNEAIDLEKTQSNFIERMTGSCTYILGEKALPKNSIYYCWFNVLNEILNLSVSVDGGRYEPIAKFETDSHKYIVEYIIEALFKKNTYKKKELIGLLEAKGYPNADVRGFSNGESLISNLKPYNDFAKIFGYEDNKGFDVVFAPNNAEKLTMIENIIKDITVFGENKAGLEKRLRGEYPSLSAEQIRQIKSLSYRGWGNLSKALIFGITSKSENEMDRGQTILQLMYRLRRNFISIYSDEKFGFKEQVEAKWAENNRTFAEQVKELTASAEVKRGINQAFLIVKELEHVMGKPPENIFIEFARETGLKRRTSSRQKQLAKKYESIEKDYQEIYDGIRDNADKLENEAYKNRFNEEKFYLYFIQGGRCMYTNEPLDLNKLDQYDVDHIVPQSIIKDDSIENKALVKKSANMHKLDSDVVPPEYQNISKKYWRQLKDAELISAEKYTRLTRKELTSDDLGHFIKRQLVETRQITKNVAILLSEYFKHKGTNVGIYPIKANMNSLFRRCFGYPKGEGARAINDLHHAKDAYISVFMGKYLLNNFELSIIEKRHTEFNKTRFYNRINKQGDRELTDKEARQARYRENGIVLYNMSRIDDPWDETNQNGKTIGQMLENFDRNYYKIDCYVSRKTESSDVGQLFKETLYKNEANRIKFGITDNQTLISIGKNNGKYFDVNQYGGYTSIQFAKFAIVEGVDKEGKHEVKFIGIPRLYLMPTSDRDIGEYFAQNNLFDAKIIHYIPKYQLVEDSQLRLVYITGGRDKYTAHQFVINRENKDLNAFIYYIYKYDVNFDKWVEDDDYIDWKEDNLEQQISDFINTRFAQFVNYYLKHIEMYYPQDSTYKTLKTLLNQAVTDYSIEEKVKLIPQLLNITANHASTGNLKEYTVFKGNEKIKTPFVCFDENGEKIKLAESAGKITSGLDLENAYFIYTSITGIYSKKKKILD